MPITYSHPQSDASAHEANVRTTKAQLEKLDKSIKSLEDEADRDPYASVPRLKLMSLRPLRDELRHRLRQYEANYSEATGSCSGGPAALTAGNYFTGADY